MPHKFRSKFCNVLFYSLSSCIQSSCRNSGYTFFPYKLDDKKRCYVCDQACLYLPSHKRKGLQIPSELDTEKQNEQMAQLCPLLKDKLKDILDEIQVTNR